MDPMVFQFIGETVQNATNAFVAPAASRLMFALQMVALTGVTLYITLTGYAISTGAVEAPFQTFLKQCAKIIIIAAFALTADGYTGAVMEAFNGLETGLADALNVDDGDENGGDADSIYQVLDKSLGKGVKIVLTCFEAADKAGLNFGAVLGWAIAGLTVAISTALVTVIGGAVVISAKFFLAIVFALGPLFILTLMFPMTAKFFDSWFAQVINYTLTIVIMAVVMSFAMKAYDSFIATAKFSGPNAHNPLFAALQIGVVTSVLIWVIMQIGGMASGLAGGVSMAAMSIRHLMMPITGAMSAIKGAHKLLDPMTTRRDMHSGMMTTARRSNHMVAGNTMWNPAYRQHVMQNMGKNWGAAKGGAVNH